MVIYEYECSKCEVILDVSQDITDEPLEVCLQCKYKTFKRLISKSSFKLKGTGWYETDYKGK